MNLPNAPRRGKDRPRRVHFSHQPIKNGSRQHAYIAGPTWWGYLHRLKRSKCCLHEITNGELLCRECNRPHVALMTGAVPMYNEVDGDPIFVYVDEEFRDQVDRLELHARVLVGRELNKGSGMWITRALTAEPTYTPRQPERSVAASITTTLLAVWKQPELCDWFYRTHGRSDNAVSMPVPAREVIADPAQNSSTAANQPLSEEQVLTQSTGSIAVDDALRRIAVRRGIMTEGEPAKKNGKPKGGG